MPGAPYNELRPFTDALERVCSAGGVFFTSFMERPQWEQCGAAAARAGVPFYTSGGFEDAERRVACATLDEEPPAFPICCLSMEWPRDAAPPAHRDILGALLAQGIDRRCVGDIRFEDGRAYAALTDKVSPFVSGSMTQAGGARVHTALCHFPDVRQQGGSMVRINCASLRLDAVLQAALRLPRAKAQAVIREGRVRVNFADEKRPDARINEGDAISVRGFGRVRLHNIAGESKKGRLFADVEILH